MRVLIVDDVDVLGRLLSINLRDAGHQCISLAEHVDVLLDPDHDMWHVDVLITDLRMPVVSGLMLLKIAKQYHPNIYRVAITAYDVQSHALVGVTQTAHTVLQKPVDPLEIVALVDSLAS